MGVRVPYLGPIRPGRSSGPAVIYAKRALKAAGFFKGRTSGAGAGYAGPFFAAALKRFAEAKSLPKTDGKGNVVPGRRAARALPYVGVLGPKLHVKLAPYYDDYGATHLRAMMRLRRIAAVQAAGIAAMRLVITNRASIHYTQLAGRMMGVTLGLVPPRYPTRADCSSMATWISYVMDRVARRFGGRYPDPNGLGYNGYGYTGTMIKNGTRVAWQAGARAFTQLFFGRGTISHVVTKYTASRGESHGSESGPVDVPLSPMYRGDYQYAHQYVPEIPA